MVTTAMHASARAAATASRAARRRPVAARPVTANGTALTARQAAATPARAGPPWPPGTPDPVRATNAPIPATTAQHAPQVVQPRRRPDRSRTVATLKMSDDAVSICTTVSGPERSAKAWTENATSSALMPSSHHGRRISSRSRDGRPAASRGAAAAWCC
jgi:hypothetical protein